MATNQMRREAAKRKLERQQQRRIEQAKKRKRNVVITVVGVVAAAAVIGVVLASLPAATPPAPTAPPAAAAAVTPASIPTQIVPVPKRTQALPATVNCTYGADPQGQPASKPNNKPPTASISTQGTTTLTLQTGDGAIPLVLDRALAPCTVNSMVSLTRQGYFDGTTCHRLTTDAGLQVLQCGDPSGTGGGGPGYTTPDELFPGIAYGRGVLAMANTGQPNSGGSQFFIVYGDAQLPPSYTVFGSIGADGLQVVDTIAKRGYDKSTEMGAGGGKPLETVTIEKATIS